MLTAEHQDYCGIIGLNQKDLVTVKAGSGWTDMGQ